MEKGIIIFCTKSLGYLYTTCIYQWSPH